MPVLCRSVSAQSPDWLVASRRQEECAKTARIQMALPSGKPGRGTANNLYEELGDNAM